MSLQSIENSLCRAQRNYQSPQDKIGRGLLALIDLTRHVQEPVDELHREGYRERLRNIRKLAAKLMTQLDAVRYNTDLPKGMWIGKRMDDTS